MSEELTRRCTKCGEEKDILLFGKDRRGRGGISARCRECNNAKNREAYYKRNKNRSRRPPKLSDEELSRRNAARAKRWREENPDYMRDYHRKAYEDPVRREEILARNRGWAAQNKDKIKARNRRYREKHRERLLQKCRKWHEDHPEYNTAVARKERAQSRENETTSLEKIFPKARSRRSPSELSKESFKRKYHGDTSFKIAMLLRGSLNKALCGDVKKSSALDALGCSLDEFKKHLESMFYPHPETGEEMTWANHTYYGWHIDHILPLSSFDLTDREQLLEACHYTNLRPLWAVDNLKKGAKVA